MKRRELKSKWEKERYTYVNAEFQRIARRGKKTFLNDQCKEIEENNRMGKTRDLIKKVWRRQWQPILVLLPGKSHRQRSLVGCSPWGCEESDMTERFHFYFRALEKEMATHSSVLAWRISRMGSLVSCRLWGHTELDMTEAT